VLPFAWYLFDSLGRLFVQSLLANLSASIIVLTDVCYVVIMFKRVLLSI